MDSENNWRPPALELNCSASRWSVDSVCMCSVLCLSRPRPLRADGKPVDGCKPDCDTLLDRDVRLVSDNIGQRQFHRRLEVHVRRQVKVGVARLRSNDSCGDSGHTAVDDAEREAWRGAWKDCVGLGSCSGNPPELQMDFTGHAEEAADTGD